MENRDRDKLKKSSNVDSSSESSNEYSNFGKKIGRSENIGSESSRRSGSVGEGGMTGSSKSGGLGGSSKVKQEESDRGSSSIDSSDLDRDRSGRY